MISRVNKYAFINAQLRARISSIFNEELLKDLCQSADVDDFFSKLGQSGFVSAAEAFRDTGDTLAAEAALWREEIKLIEDIKKGTDDQIGVFIDSFLIRYEIDYLKTLIRGWFEKRIKERSLGTITLFESKLPGCIRIKNPQEIMDAPDLGAVCEALKGSVYAGLIREQISAVNEAKSLFPLEMALDKYYYSQLYEVVDGLPGEDSRIVKKLLAAEVDLQNISWLLRFRNMYGDENGATRTGLLPHGRTVTEKTLKALDDAQSGREFLANIVSANYSELNLMMNLSATDGRARLTFLERILDEILIIEVRRSMSSNPFNIGIIMAYIIMKRAEIRKILTVMNGLIFGLPKEEILGRL